MATFKVGDQVECLVDMKEKYKGAINWLSMTPYLPIKGSIYTIRNVIHDPSQAYSGGDGIRLVELRNPIPLNIAEPGFFSIDFKAFVPPPSPKRKSFL